MTVEPIAHIRTDFPEKFGIPRQSGRVKGLTGHVVFTEKYRRKEALRGIEEFSHLWILFDFSESHCEKFSPTVRPPRLGGNTRVGVFASRSPFRPNSIGLSLVKLVGVESHPTLGEVLVVEGADLLDGTPVYDVKPYLPYTDCRTDAVGGYAERESRHRLLVDFPPSLLEKLPPEKREGALGCLQDDPRPSYRTEKQAFTMAFAGFDIRFEAEGNTARVLSVERR